jgi:hypothetical protein
MQTRALDAVTGVPAIPAMTSEAERACYYRLTREAAGKGAIIEFGAWLGASTAYIAAAVRDSGEPVKAQVYDKFQSKKGHALKVRKFYAAEGVEVSNLPIGDAQPHFERNLGPLLAHVDVHKGQIEHEKWGDEPIALIVNDAPKRVPAISAVLTNFLGGIREGTVMAWQDFCHFPSYEIPACLYRLRGHFEFVESVVPGSTLVFRVVRPWVAGQVTQQVLSLNSWHPDEIVHAWEYWLDFVPAEKQALFRCGAAMFLCDIGHPEQAKDILATVLRERHEDVVSKWRYLSTARPDFLIRYKPLFDCFNRHEKRAA